MNGQATPYFGFVLDADVQARLHALLTRIRGDASAPDLPGMTAEVISDLLRTALRSFYFDPVAAIPTPAGTRKSTDAGINTVLKGTLLVVQRMAHSLEPGDLSVFAQYMQTLMIERDGALYIAYPLTTAQARDLENVIGRIRQDANTNAYNHLIVDVLCRLTDEAVKHFYDTPTRMIKIRAFIKKSADLAIRTVSKGIHFVIRQLFRRTRQRELILFSRFLQQQLVYA